MDSIEIGKIEVDDGATFLPAVQSSTYENTSKTALLSREDLLNLARKEPKWRRIRIILLILFWVVWAGLLVASIIVIVLSPKCPPRPPLTFWQSKVGYWLDPYAFRDSGNDLIGDFKGLIEKIDYIQKTVGAGFVILDDFLSKHKSGEKRLGLTNSFKLVDPPLGTMNDFSAMIRAFHKKGLEVVVSLNFNSVSTSHEWVSNSVFLKGAIDNTFTRSGVSTKVIINSAQYYSSFGHGTVDLNLQSPSVIKEIMTVVEHWLNQGADGILLSNAAFFVESDTPLTPQTNFPGDVNSWFKTYPSKQIFVPQSRNVVKSIRESVDAVSRNTGKSKLLAVDPGDTGFGFEDKQLGEIFLDLDKSPAAHLLISRQFVLKRGWKTKDITHVESPSIKSYNSLYTKHKRSLALTTATPSDRHHGDVFSLASILLLPGTPLLYYGAELGQDVGESTSLTLDMYPKDEVPLVNNAPHDSELACHLPMPWDHEWLGFSSAYIKTKSSVKLDYLGMRETVETATAAGRAETPFQLVQSLIRLRENPSLLWGEFELLKSQDFGPSVNFEVFLRKAKGYPAFVNILVTEQAKFSQMVRLPDFCKSLTPRFIYPSSPKLELDKVIKNNRVFIETNGGTAVYVFECQDI